MSMSKSADKSFQQGCRVRKIIYCAHRPPETSSDMSTEKGEHTWAWGQESQQSTKHKHEAKSLVLRDNQEPSLLQGPHGVLKVQASKPIDQPQPFP
jgi:hypothetical protein